jgi:hypothetical protein
LQQAPLTTARKCWIDDGTAPVYAAWVSDIKDEGATIAVEDGKSLPGAFKVYFDEHFFVGRNCTVQKHEGDAYAVRFTGRTRTRPAS